MASKPVTIDTEHVLNYVITNVYLIHLYRPNLNNLLQDRNAVQRQFAPTAVAGKTLERNSAREKKTLYMVCYMYTARVIIGKCLKAFYFIS